MIIDCHGHYTTAPAGHDAFRKAQVAHFNDRSLPAAVYPTISDDELRDSVEANQLRLLRERGADMTIFSPRASTMAHHIGDEQVSAEWTRRCNDLIARVVQLYPDQFSKLEKDMINGFGSAKEQWFSSFMLQVEANCSWHRLFVDPLSRAMYSSKGPDFEYMQARRQEGVDIHDAVYGLACRNFKDEMAELESRIPVNDMEDKQ